MEQDEMGVIEFFTCLQIYHHNHKEHEARVHWNVAHIFHARTRTVSLCSCVQSFMHHLPFAPGCACHICTSFEQMTSGSFCLLQCLPATNAQILNNVVQDPFCSIPSTAKPKDFDGNGRLPCGELVGLLKFGVALPDGSATIQTCKLALVLWMKNEDMCGSADGKLIMLARLCWTFEPSLYSMKVCVPALSS
jgi:hypothetical protein